MVSVKIDLGKKDFIWMGLVIVLIGAGFVVATWDSSKAMFHNSEDVKVTIEGVDYSLQEAIDGALLGASGGMALGDWVSMGTSTATHTAVTDGFVVAWGNGGHCGGGLLGYTDSNTASLVEMQRSGSGYIDTARGGSITMPVKAGDDWKIGITGCMGILSIYWIPIVSGGSSVVSVVGGGTSFGDWVDVSAAASGGAVQGPATTDGIVSAVGYGGGTVPRNGYTDSVNANTLRTSGNYPNAGNPDGLTMPVKKGDYWKVTGVSNVYWIPVYSGGVAARGSFNAAGTLSDQFNIASVTWDSGSNGEWDVVFSSPLSDLNYVAIATVGDATDSTDYYTRVRKKTVNGFSIYIKQFGTYGAKVAADFVVFE